MNCTLETTLKWIHKKLYRISGFQIDKSKVEKIVNSQSFSIYSSGEIELLLTNPTYQRRFKLSTSSICDTLVISPAALTRHDVTRSNLSGDTSAQTCHDGEDTFFASGTNPA
jgi:hypothetical protein